MLFSNTFQFPPQRSLRPTPAANSVSPDSVTLPLEELSKNIDEPGLCPGVTHVFIPRGNSLDSLNSLVIGVTSGFWMGDKP